MVYGTGELFTQDKGRDFDHFLVGVKHSKNDEDAKTTITNRSTFNRHTVERNGSNYWSIVPKGAEQDEDAQGWTIALKSTMNTQPPEILYGKSIWLLNDVKTKNNVVSCTSAVVDSHYLVFNPFTGLGFKNPVFSAEDGEEVVADGITVSGDIRNLQVIDTNNGHDIVVPVGSNISVNLGNLNLGRRTWFKY